MALDGYSDIGAVAASDNLDPVWGNGARANQNLFASLFNNKHVIYVDNTIATLSNSTNDLTIFEYTIPGGTLGSGGVVVGADFLVAFSNNGAGTPANWYHDIKLGGNSLPNPKTNNNWKPTIDTGGTPLPTMAHIWIMGNGSTSSQIGIAIRDVEATTVYTNLSQRYYTASEDSTGDLVLGAYLAWGAASSLLVSYRYWAQVWISKE